MAGRLNDPQLSGQINGDNLYYRHQTQGLILDNGVLRSRLQGQKWVIDSLKFHRGGTIELKGAVNLANANPDVDVDIVFDKYRTSRVQTATAALRRGQSPLQSGKKRRIGSTARSHRLRQGLVRKILHADPR